MAQLLQHRSIHQNIGGFIPSQGCGFYSLSGHVSEATDQYSSHTSLSQINKHIKNLKNTAHFILVDAESVSPEVVKYESQKHSPCLALGLHFQPPSFSSLKQHTHAHMHTHTHTPIAISPSFLKDFICL